MSTPDDPLKASADQLKLFVPALLAGADRLVIELRALNVPQQYGNPATLAGFFDLPGHKKELWAAVRQLVEPPPDRQPEGVYLTVNPLHEDLLARVNGRLKKQGRASDCATDADVIRRRFILVDVDPRRRARICATDEEKAAAKLLIDGVRDDLRGRGWGEPVLVNDSGSGFHHWYGIDWPADDGRRVERFIKWLAARHNTPAATIDTTVFNPARIARFPGTWNRKGENVPARPHRFVTVLESNPWTTNRPSSAPGA